MKSQNTEQIMHIINSKTLWLYLPRLFCETRNCTFCVKPQREWCILPFHPHFLFFFFFTGLWSDILDLFIKPLIRESILLMICAVRSSVHEMQCLHYTNVYFLLFSADIKGIVSIASTTQTAAYLLACNYTDISSIFKTLKEFSKDS